MNQPRMNLFPKQKGLLHGGDYNPEQWGPDTWQEDDLLMKETHVNSVTLGVFSWVSLEPEEGRYTFDWLDRIMDIQAAAGRTVCLATPTAAIPAWMAQKYPEVLRVGPDRKQRLHGNRVNMCWSSPVFRIKAVEIGTKLAERYGNHPALSAWHISNEFGGACYSNLTRDDFRRWLKDRYRTLDNLNQAYWTAFWSHTYTDWDQIEIPGDPYGETSIQGLTLDWKRFCSHQIIDFYRLERDNLQKITPHIPCTTNLMGTYDGVDGFAIAKEMDFVCWDSYPWFSGRPDRSEDWAYPAFGHDLNRSMKGGKPFLLMECAPSVSNWYTVWHQKRPGQHVLEGLQAVAHGADGVQYFQWRQSRGSLEQFHGAVVAHNNSSKARVFEEVKDLGDRLATLGEVAGSEGRAEIALIFDWENKWAIDTALGYRTDRLRYVQTVQQHYRPLLFNQFAVDICESISDLSRYKVVIAPMLFMLRPGVAENLARYVESGGTLITTYLSGWVDENLRTFVGGFPEPLRKALGVWSEVWDELYEDQKNSVNWHDEQYECSEFCEQIHAEGAEVLGRYSSDYYAGQPCLTRNFFGEGTAYYVAARTGDDFLNHFLPAIARESGVKSVFTELQAGKGVSVRKRCGDGREVVFLLNYNSHEATCEIQGTPLYEHGSDKPVAGKLSLQPFEVRVLTTQPAKIVTSR